jgi:hypothetical protein
LRQIHATTAVLVRYLNLIQQGEPGTTAPYNLLRLMRPIGGRVAIGKRFGPKLTSANHFAPIPFNLLRD